MNNQGQNCVLLRILYQIQQGSKNVIDRINKSVVIICKKGVSIEQVFYILFFNAVILKQQQGVKSREFILNRLITL